MLADLDMLTDLRLGIRSLLKQPGFSAIAIVTLALGIGATTSIFNLIQGTLLTPPPYREPDKLVLISSARTDGQPGGEEHGWAADQWQDWQKTARSFDSLAAYGWSFNFLVLADGSQSLEGMSATQSYFQTVGLKPLLGRTFSNAEATFPAKPVIILGYNLWQRKFGGDPAVIGKTIRISRQPIPLQIIGIMRAGVRFLPSPSAAKEPNYDPDAQVDFWVPDSPNPKYAKYAGWNVVGRLKDGVTLQQAQSELNLVTTREARLEPTFAGFAPKLDSLPREMNRDGGKILWPLLGAAALVLLIACGNTASLMLVRGLQRQQEYAVRSALGMPRLELFWQASAENLLIALCGGLLGVGLAFGITKLFMVIGGHAIPRLDAVEMGWPILAFGLGAAFMSAILAGLIPALRASRVDPAQALKSAGPKSSAGAGERRLLRGVAMTQTALTLALLVGAGLLVKTMNNLAKVNMGYDTSHLLTMSVTAVQGDSAKRDDFHRLALERVSALPGVKQAAFAWGVPLTGNNWPDAVEVEGQPLVNKDADKLLLPLRSMTPDYFKAMGISLLEGRGFRSNDDGKGAPVAIVNQALAGKYFAGSSALGKKLWLSGRDKPANLIIGVVQNGRTDDLTQAAQPEVYLSFWQAGAFSKHLVVRTAADPQAMVSSVEHELRLVDSSAAVENVKTLDEIRDDSLAPRTFATQLLTGFSLVGSVLTLIGIYGVLSLSVASRRREIAIRTAVGAEKRDIRQLVFADGFRLIAVGLLSGIAAAFLLGRILRTFLFGVEPMDPVILGLVGVLFTIVALLACWVPSMRAAAVQPAEALRYE